MESPNKDEIAEKRRSAKLTQEQAAALIHTTRRTWQAWEYGTSPMHAGLWELFLIKTKPVTYLLKQQAEIFGDKNV